MDKQEYIILNKTAIQKRIEKLEKEIDDKKIDVEVQRLIKHELKQILSNSAPIIPEIEKAWEDGRNGTALVGNFPFVETKYVNKTSKDYISNLKLDV